jgi:hypothetical protein
VVTDGIQPVGGLPTEVLQAEVAVVLAQQHESSGGRLDENVVRDVVIASSRIQPGDPGCTLPEGRVAIPGIGHRRHSCESQRGRYDKDQEKKPVSQVPPRLAIRLLSAVTGWRFSTFETSSLELLLP